MWVIQCEIERERESRVHARSGSMPRVNPGLWTRRRTAAPPKRSTDSNGSKASSITQPFEKRWPWTSSDFGLFTSTIVFAYTQTARVHYISMMKPDQVFFALFSCPRTYSKQNKTSTIPKSEEEETILGN